MQKTKLNICRVWIYAFDQLSRSVFCMAFSHCQPQLHVSLVGPPIRPESHPLLLLSPSARSSPY